MWYRLLFDGYVEFQESIPNKDMINRKRKSESMMGTSLTIFLQIENNNSLFTLLWDVPHQVNFDIFNNPSSFKENFNRKQML